MSTPTPVKSTEDAPIDSKSTSYYIPRPTLIKHNRREIHVGLDMILPSDKHIRPQMNVQVTTLELSATDCIDKVRIPIHRLT